jgi:carbamoyl-phosphate synthase large subunit
MNLLISCAGRQVSLLKAFMETLEGDGEVVACDINPHAAALSIVKHAISLPYAHPDYISNQLEICRQFSVDVMLSLNLKELACLEACRMAFEAIGVKLIGAPMESIRIATDKLATAQACEQWGVNCPKTWPLWEVFENEERTFPLMIKPRFGQGGQGIFRVDNDISLRRAFAGFKKAQLLDYIAQEFIEGQEYGIDVINNLHGEYAGHLSRRKLAMRCGETDIAQTISPEPFGRIAKILAEHMSHHGIMDVDLIGCGENFYVLDLNLRFGGGYAFSHLAGANVPAAILAWAQDREVEHRWLVARNGVTGARFSSIGTIGGDDM